MKRNYPFTHLIIFCFSAILLFLSACKDETPEPTPNPPVTPTDPCEFPADETGYNLVWSQEFDESELDTSFWTYQLGNGCDIGLCGWGNEELQIYTDEAENISIDSGMLRITALEVSPGNYTSARINTSGKISWRFGRFDIRAKLPTGQGLWPAIWMLPEEWKYGGWPQSGEIDIMEIIGSKPNELHGTLHYGQPAPLNKQRGNTYRLQNGDFSDDFHVFSVEWRSNCIRWLIDGEQYGTPINSKGLLPENYPFNEKFHMLLNVAVGGRWPGDPDSTTMLPANDGS